MLISLIILATGLILVGITRKGQRVRRVIRWMGLTFMLMLLFLWVSSMRYAFGYVGSSVAIYYESGGFAVFATHGQWPATGWGVGRSRFRTIWFLGVPALVPLWAGWLPTVAVAVPLAFTWRERKPLPGHCPECEYDLTGNVSGVCPECGTKVKDP